MAVSNTALLIKRSSTTSTPSSLLGGELAYSYSSNNIFIGSADGSTSYAIGGKVTYDTVNSATSDSTAGTLVKRDDNNAFYATLYGNSNTATQLQTSRNFSISGGDISASSVAFNGTGAVTLNASLNAVPGLSAGDYGSATAIPTLTIAANGRILAVSTHEIDVSYPAFVANAAWTGANSAGSYANSAFLKANAAYDYANTIASSGVSVDSWARQAANSAATYANGSFVQANSAYDKANTANIIADGAFVQANAAFITANSKLSSSGGTISGSLAITGDLIVSGDQVINDVSTIRTEDTLIKLAANNAADALDIGFYGEYVNSGTKYTGLVRQAAGEYFLFKGLTNDPTGNVLASGSATSANTATLRANITGGIVSSLAAAIVVGDGGTGRTTFSDGAILVGNGTGGLNTLANSTYTHTGSYDLGSSNTITSITVDAYGRLTGTSANPIALPASAINSGVFGYSRGGTGSTSYTQDTLLVAGDTGFRSLANSTFTATGSGATNNTLTSLTVDAYGRLTAATYQSISGLTVTQGGTGAATFTSKGIIYGNGTGAMSVTAAADTSDQTWSNQILTVNNSGTPIWTNTLDGGIF